MGEVKLDIDDETVRRTREEIEANAKTQIDPTLTNMILELLGAVEGDVQKDVIIKTLLAFTWVQRLYFIVRSALMGIMGAVLMAAIVLIIGKVDALQVAIIGVASFIASLAITRLCDASITASSKLIVTTLSRHERLRKMILSHF